VWRDEAWRIVAATRLLQLIALLLLLLWWWHEEWRRTRKVGGLKIKKMKNCLTFAVYNNLLYSFHYCTYHLKN
jgi:hypothetical protein